MKSLPVLERPKALARAVAHEPLQQALLDLAPAFILTLRQGSVAQVNEHYLRVSGFTREEVLFQPFESFLHATDRERWVAHREQQLSGGATPAPIEFRYLLKSGGIRWADCRTTVSDLQGLPALSLVAMDITDRKHREAALRDAENKYRLLFDSMHEAYVRTDLDGHILEFNELFRSFLGYTAQELRQCSLQDVTPSPWHVMETTILLGPVLERGYSDVYEKEYRRKDGSVFPAELRSFLLRDERGHPCAIWALVRDITARKQTMYAQRNARDKLEGKVLGRSIELVETIVSLRRQINEREQAEAALQHEKALTDAIIATMPGTFYVLEAHGHFVRWNQTLQELVGLTTAQLRTVDALAWVHPEDHPAARAKLAEVLQVGCGEIEVRLVFRPEAPERNYLLTGRRMELGNQVFLIGCGLDVTERKQAEAALRASEEQHRRLVHQLCAGVVVHAPDTSIILANPEACRLLGLPANAIHGETLASPVWHFVHEDGRPMAPADHPVQHVAVTHQPLRDYVVGVDRPARQERVWLLVSAFPEFTADERLQQIVVTFVDITERKRVGLQIVEAIEREQRRIGHDLHDGVGQQITGLRFMSSALRRKLEEQKIAEYKVVARLESLLNDALGQVRELAHGLHPVNSDHQGLMGSLQGLAQQVTQLFGFPCLFECPTAVLVADNQVATNLYRIAQEATRNAAAHAKPAHIWIRLHQRTAAIRLEIQDDGQGLPAEPEERKGLGLDIMKYRAASIGATFAWHSAPGAGTTVACTLHTSQETHHDKA